MQNSTNKPKILGIEGLRGLSVVSTVFAHLPVTTAIFSHLGLISPWHMGVSLFYVISGFLISASITSDSYSFGKFLFRRVARLYPILVLSLILYYIICSFLDTNNKIIVQFYNDKYWKTIFYSNMLAISDIAPYSAQNTLASGGLWSISVEIKFYIVIALLMTLGRTKYRVVLVGGLVLGLFVRTVLIIFNDEYAYSHMFYVEAFLVGALVHQFQSRKLVTPMYLYFSFLFIVLFPSILVKNMFFMVEYIILLISLGIIISHASRSNAKFFMWKHWCWLGERSYTIYIFHFHVLALSGLVAQLLGLNYNFILYNTILFLSIIVSLIIIDKIYTSIEKPLIHYSRIITSNNIKIKNTL